MYSKREQSRLEKKSMDELLMLMKNIQEDILNKNDNKNSIWIYKKSAQRKLDNIAWAITYKLQKSKK